MKSKMSIQKAVRGLGHRRIPVLAAALLAGGSWLGSLNPAQAQTCPEPTASQFRATALLTTGFRHPVHMAMAPDKRIFVADMRTGDIQLYKPGATSLTVAGKVPTRYDNEDGFLGLTLHPKFAQNGFLFAMFTHATVNPPSHVLVRYKVNGDVVDIASGVELLKIPRVTGARYHAAGGMAWDGNDNLIIGTGDDTNPHGAPNDGFGAIYWKEAGKDAQKSAANTNDLRGKVLRIHPVETAVDGKYYTIPAGNLKEVYASLWPNQADKDKVRPEILAMGARNPFRVSAHPTKGWVFFGDVGPDAGGNSATRGRAGHDELNFVTEAGNYGWPYCNGNNFAYNNVDYSGATGVPGAAFDCANLTNSSPNNTGVAKLPPARPATIWYAASNTADWKEVGTGSETAMAGPVYQFDASNPSTTKFPPQFHGRLLFYDWSRQVFRLITLDDQGKYKSIVNFPLNNPGSSLGSVTGMEYGPDGSLYVLRYSNAGYGGEGTTGALYRVDYTGTYDPSCAPVSIAQGLSRKPGQSMVTVSGIQPLQLPSGIKGFDVFDLSGRKVWNYVRAEAQDDMQVHFPAHLKNQLLQVRYQ